jgi:hypothetical protein
VREIKMINFIIFSVPYYLWMTIHNICFTRNPESRKPKPPYPPLIKEIKTKQSFFYSPVVVSYGENDFLRRKLRYFTEARFAFSLYGHLSQP